MSLRSLCVFAACALILAAGCRKKEDEPEPEQPGNATQVSAPEGFARIDGDLFMTKRPPRIEEYVQYLQSTGQQMPEWVESPDVNYQDPVTGLTRQQAEAFATWKLLEVPTEQQWQMAREVVGNTPYPWGPDAAGETPMYLVRTWTEDTPAEQKAIDERQELLRSMIQARKAEAEVAAQELEELTNNTTEEITKRWQELKTAISELVQRQKALAKQTAQIEGQKTVLKILEQVGNEKKKVIGAIIKDNATPEELEKAKKQYEDFLERQRNDVQDLTDTVVQRNKELSEQARDLTERLEQRGERLVQQETPAGDKQTQERAESPDPAELARRREKLEDAMADVKKVAADTQARIEKAGQEVQDKSSALQEKLEETETEQELAGKIGDMKERIQNLNENINDQFMQEPHLFKELTEFTELTATKQAVQAEVATLKDVLDRFESADTGTAADPAEEPHEADTTPSADETLLLNPLFHYIVLGLLQGATEFLPISSSGHLVAAQSLLSLKEPGILLEVSLHFGTLVAILIVFRKDLWLVLVDSVQGLGGLCRGIGCGAAMREAPLFPVGVAVVVGTFPAAIAGVLFHDALTSLFQTDLLTTGIFLCITGMILAAARFAPEGATERVGPVTGLLIGFAQALALLPGVSRSGATIVAGYFLGVKRARAARFSFLLAVPALAGAMSLEVTSVLAAEGGASGMSVRPACLVAGTATAALTGWLCLELLLRIVERGKLHWFAAYCLPVGIALVIFGMLRFEGAG